MRVLLIEDDPTISRSIELMLTSEGFNTYCTDLGEEGLDLGKLYDYDIILLDLNLLSSLYNKNLDKYGTTDSGLFHLNLKLYILLLLNH